MSRFYFSLWLFWLFRVVLCTLFIAILISAAATLFIYMKQGMLPLHDEVLAALYDIWHFWFIISLNIALLIALFRSVKYLFNRCHGGYMLKLKVCQKIEKAEFIEIIGYGDLVKVWRRWFMLLIWLVAAEIIFSVAVSYLLSSSMSLFDWFSIYILYLFIAVGAYFSFIFLSSRCKAIKVVKC